MAGLRSLLFPDPPRAFRGRRAVKVALRAVHVLCAGVVVGAYLLTLASDVRTGWLLAAIVSGALVLAVDLHESAAFFVQVRGVVVVAKLVLLGLLPRLGEAGAWILAAIVLVSVVSSHAPGEVRHFLVAGRGSIRGGHSRG